MSSRPFVLLLLLHLWRSALFSRDHMLANGPPGWAVRRWRAPWWIRQLAPAPGLGEVERGRRCRELRDVPRVSFLTGDCQRWVEERKRIERGGGWAGGRRARIIDDPFVCFAAEDFESIATCVALPGLAASAPGEEMSGRMWKMLKKSQRYLCSQG
ncbi:hypothetical protein PBY51_015604 [Eleginops maclovinus]|uniref:Uncharacterized protein n=1 Tax=Eleginops maclovinus TaxID=56733 RepID=A0AAN7XR62_ELEMC|nr:hypothetical protein PBY51_015604 [Eleginops maclovinus]